MHRQGAVRHHHILEARGVEGGICEHEHVGESGHRDVAAWEVRIVAPRPFKRGCVAFRIGVEEGVGRQVAVASNARHAQATEVVRRINLGAAHVQVVVHRGVVRFVVPQHHRVVQIRDISDVRPGPVAEALLVQFVVEKDQGVVFVQPPLVGVRRLGVVEGRDKLHVRLVGDIHDRHSGAAIEAERHFMIGVIGVRPFVHDHLRIVGVRPVVGSSRDWRRGVVDIHRVQPAAGRVGANAVGEARLLVHGNVVGVAKPEVGRHRGQLHRACRDDWNFGQVDHLNAMT